MHYIEVAIDRLLGRERFMNEIIWAYDYGGRPKTRWTPKHDTMPWYALNPEDYVFNFDEMDRIPYMAPGLRRPAQWRHDGQLAPSQLRRVRTHGPAACTGRANLPVRDWRGFV